MAAHGLQHVERAQGVDLEILARVDDRRGDRHLAGQMEHDRGRGLGHGRGQRVIVAHVGLDNAQPLAAVAFVQPGQIGAPALARQVVVEGDGLAAPQEVVGAVAADEPGSAGDEDVLIIHN